MMAAFYTACTSFIAQNLGARKRDRIRKAYLVTQMYSFIIGAVLGALLVVFRTQFLSLFTSDPDVLHYGSIRLGIMGCSYLYPHLWIMRQREQEDLAEALYLQ